MIYFTRIMEKIMDEQLKISDKLDVLPHPEIELIEHTLGVSFGEKRPTKVVNNNRLTKFLVSQSAKKDGPIKAAVKYFEISINRKHTVAEYFPQFDIVTVSQSKSVDKKHAFDEERRSTIHEDLHAWQMRINPQYLEETQKNVKDLIKKIGEKKLKQEEVETAVEAWMISKLLTEGMSDFGANYVGLVSDTISDKVPYLTDHILHSDPEANIGDVVNDIDSNLYNFDEAQYFNEAKQITDIKDRLVHGIMTGNIVEVMKAQNEARDLYNPLGYKIIQTLVDLGRDDNLEISQIFNNIMKNPFSRFNEIIIRDTNDSDSIIH